MFLFSTFPVTRTPACSVAGTPASSLATCVVPSTGFTSPAPRVSSFVPGFKWGPLGSSQVSLPASLTLLSSGWGTVGLSQNSGCEQPTVFLPHSPGPPPTRTTHIASWRSPTPVLWPTLLGTGDSQGTQTAPDLLRVSIFRVGLGEAGAGQRDPTQLEKLT